MLSVVSWGMMVADVQMQSPDLPLSLRECRDGLHAACSGIWHLQGPRDCMLVSSFRVGNKGGALDIQVIFVWMFIKDGESRFQSLRIFSIPENMKVLNLQKIWNDFEQLHTLHCIYILLTFCHVCFISFDLCLSPALSPSLWITQHHLFTYLFFPTIYTGYIFYLYHHQHETY